MFVYGSTDYKCNKCNVKILKFHDKDGLAFKISDNGVDIIKCKFENYYDVMYKNENIPRYDILWSERKVYK